jgi:hypothetical protein
MVKVPVTSYRQNAAMDGGWKNVFEFLQGKNSELVFRMDTKYKLSSRSSMSKTDLKSSRGIRVYKLYLSKVLYAAIY